MSVPLYPFSAWFDNVALAGLCSKETLRHTYDLARMAIANNIPGDFVECGVFGGANAAMMARALRYDVSRDPRRIHLFDSFSGIPAPGEHDIGWTNPPGTSACDLEECQRHMREWQIPEMILVWHPGMFDKTVVEAAAVNDMNSLPWKKIAILRLDGDLYESTKTCLEYLYPLVSPGGYVIVDDYALPGCRKAVDDYFGGGIQAPVYFQRSK